MYYIGIDVGGMSIKGGIVDENGNIIVKDSVVTKPTQPSDDNAKDIAGLVAKLLEDAGISTDEIAGMGMGVPGTVDPDTAKIFIPAIFTSAITISARNSKNISIFPCISATTRTALSSANRCSAI